jgi:hypothetical protein
MKNERDFFMLKRFYMPKVVEEEKREAHKKYNREEIYSEDDERKSTHADIDTQRMGSTLNSIPLEYIYVHCLDEVLKLKVQESRSTKLVVVVVFFSHLLPPPLDFPVCVPFDDYFKL